MKLQYLRHFRVRKHTTSIGFVKINSTIKVFEIKILKQFCLNVWIPLHCFGIEWLYISNIRRWNCMELVIYFLYVFGNSALVVKRSPHTQGIGVRSPIETYLGRKKVVTAPLLNVWQQVWMSRVLGYDHLTVDVAR